MRYTLYLLLFIVVVGIWLIFNYTIGLKTAAPMPAPIPNGTLPYVYIDERSIWENPLINSLFIPLGLYFGKKLIDLFFSKFEKKGATS